MELSETGSRFPAVSALIEQALLVGPGGVVLPAAMTVPPGPTAGVRSGPLDVLPSGPVGSHLAPVPVLV